MCKKCKELQIIKRGQKSFKCRYCGYSNKRFGVLRYSSSLDELRQIMAASREKRDKSRLSFSG